MLPALYLTTPGMQSQMVIGTGVGLTRKGFCRSWVLRQVWKAVMDLACALAVSAESAVRLSPVVSIEYSLSFAS